MERIKLYLLQAYITIRKRFIENGGWTSKRNILYLFAALWAFYTFIKTHGWLPKKSVKKKHIFLTGGGSGLGRAMALRLAKLGGNLTLVDLNLKGLEETKRMIKAAVGKDDNIKIMELDISIRENVSKCTKAATKFFGPADIVINNAGIM